MNCDICSGNNLVQMHHALNGNPDRKLSDKYEYTKFALCYGCHHKGVHDKNIKLKYLIKRIAQENYEEKYGDRKKFMKTFKRNYIELYKERVSDEYYYNKLAVIIKENQHKRIINDFWEGIWWVK